VLIDKGNNAYLADFGIAKVSQATMQLTGSGIVGTPAYMAPEMFKNEPVTPTVDIYAMGVTLYQMLSGSAPYHGTTPVQLMYAHLNEPVPDILEVRDDLPSAVQGVIEKAMAKDPATRYQHGSALAEDLRRAATGLAEKAAAVEVAPTFEISPDTLPDKAPLPVTPPPTATPVLVSEPGKVPAVEAARQPPRASWWQLNWRMVAAIAAAIMMYGLALIAILVALGA
jgi:serine/threonine protein kinase